MEAVKTSCRLGSHGYSDTHLQLKQIDFKGRARHLFQKQNVTPFSGQSTGTAHSSRSWLLCKTDENDLNKTSNGKETVSRANSYSQYSHKKQCKSVLAQSLLAYVPIYHQPSVTEYITFENKSDQQVQKKTRRRDMQNEAQLYDESKHFKKYFEDKT